MKIIITTMLSLAVCCSAFALTEVVDGIEWSYTVSGDAAIITSGRWDPAIPQTTAGKVVVPSTLGGKSVREIGRAAFYNCHAITEIELPEGCIRIGEYGIRSCRKLVSVHVPSTVETFGSGVFDYCDSLESIDVATTNEKYGSMDGMLFEKAAKQLVRCPSDIDLTETAGTLVLPEWIESVGAYAFYHCQRVSVIEIPQNVTNIGNGAFAYCDKLREITLSTNITELATGLFQDCSELESIIVHEGVKSIRDSAFAGCSSLKNVKLPDSLYEVGANAFSRCLCLERIVLPEGVSYVGSCAFEGCSALKCVTVECEYANLSWSMFAGCTSLSELYVGRKGDCLWTMPYAEEGIFSDVSRDFVVYVPNEEQAERMWHGAEVRVAPSWSSGVEFSLWGGVLTIGDWVSYDSTICPSSDIWWPYHGNPPEDSTALSRVYEVDICENVVSIGAYAFYGFSNVQTVRMANSVTQIGEHAFEGLTRLTTATLSTNIVEIGFSAFSGCNNLREMTLPSSLRNIDNSAFYCCRFSSLDIPPCLTNIGSSAFYNNYELVDVRIPSSVMVIGSGAFEYCSSLTNVVVQEGVADIGERAFYGCNLSSVSIPTSVTHIGRCAFHSTPIMRQGLNVIDGCALGLKDEAPTTLVFPADTRLIADEAFAGVSTLEEVRIPAEIEVIGDRAFKGCTALTNVVVSATSLSFGKGVFDDCTNLTSLEFPTVRRLSEIMNGYRNVIDVVVTEGTESVCDYAFYGCSALRSVRLPDSITKIGNCAFAHCGVLSSVSLPAGVECIGDSAFQNCSALLSVVIPENVASVGSCAFSGCTSLVSLTVEDGVKKIGANAFNGCNHLTTVEIPQSVDTIDQSAFARCSRLKTVVLNEGVETIGDNAFANCSLTSVVIPNSVRSIAPTAFSGYTKLSFSMDNANFKYVDGSVYTSNGLTCVWSPLAPKIEVVGTGIRANDPTILDVTYYITSSYDKVDVRALAYENGMRSWTNVVRPETFVSTPAGTASEIGDGVACNVTNMFSWKVSSDYTNNLAKLKVEIFVKPEDLLPLDLMTIPAYNSKPTLEVSYNALSDANVMNALYWLYADKQPELSLTKGRLTANGVGVAQGTSVYGDAAVSYVFGKMGYQKLTNANYLGHVNSETRLGLSPSGTRQYAVREIAE